MRRALLAAREPPHRINRVLFGICYRSIDPAKANAVNPLIRGQLNTIRFKGLINKLYYRNTGHVIKPYAFHFRNVTQSLFMVKAFFAAIGQCPKFIVTFGCKGIIAVSPCAAIYLKSVPGSQFIGRPPGKTKIERCGIGLCGAYLIIGLACGQAVQHQFKAVGAKYSGPAALQCFSNGSHIRVVVSVSQGNSHLVLSCGRKRLFPVHKLEHELSAFRDEIAHGAGLSVLFPAWAEHEMQYDYPRFAQFANRVLGVEMDFEHPERTAREGIRTLRRFFEEIGMPTHLSQLGIKPENYEKLAANTVRTVNGPVKSYSPLDEKAIIEIYRLAE